ncbi:hypothetical protein [Micromonospora avicenniae]|uniref:hypothetical protein n=1 Tax=Micromonospora avicenniae TaxID=1198245 RepID=UPI003441C8C6
MQIVSRPASSGYDDPATAATGGLPPLRPLVTVRDMNCVTLRIRCVLRHASSGRLGGLGNNLGSGFAIHPFDQQTGHRPRLAKLKSARQRQIDRGAHNNTATPEEKLSDRLVTRL